MTKRWIIPDPQYKGELKLVVAENRPIDAICEAPHNFTTDMEPYLIVSGNIGADGQQMENSVMWHQDYLHDLKKGTLKKKGHKMSHVDHSAFIEQAKINKYAIHNSLNPFQRFFYSILGPRAHKPGAIKPFVDLLFDKDKLNGAVAGIKIDIP